VRLMVFFIALSMWVQSTQAQYYNNDNTQREAARRQAILTAQGEVDRAQKLLDAATARVKANFNASADQTAAANDLKEKQAAFDKARAAVIERLKSDPAYQDAGQKARLAAGTVQEEHAASSQPSATQVQASIEKLNQRSVQSEMEQKAIDADPIASQAQKDLEAARQRGQQNDAALKAAMLNDPDYKSAFEQLQTAKSHLTAATGQY